MKRSHIVNHNRVNLFSHNVSGIPLKQRQQLHKRFYEIESQLLLLCNLVSRDLSDQMGCALLSPLFKILPE